MWDVGCFKNGKNGVSPVFNGGDGENGGAQYSALHSFSELFLMEKKGISVEMASQQRCGLHSFAY